MNTHKEDVEFVANLAKYRDAVNTGGTTLAAAEAWLESLDQNDRLLRLLSDAFADVPLYDEDAYAEMIANGDYDGDITNMSDDSLDTGWIIWPRGTDADEVRHWFDDHSTCGLRGLVGEPTEDEDEEEQRSPADTLYIAKEARSILAETTDLGEDMNEVINEALTLLISTKEREIEKSSSVPKSQPYTTIEDLSNAIKAGLIDADDVKLYLDAGEVMVMQYTEQDNLVFTSYERDTIRECFLHFMKIKVLDI